MTHTRFYLLAGLTFGGLIIFFFGTLFDTYLLSIPGVILFGIGFMGLWLRLVSAMKDITLRKEGF